MPMAPCRRLTLFKNVETAAARLRAATSWAWPTTAANFCRTSGGDSVYVTGRSYTGSRHRPLALRRSTAKPAPCRAETNQSRAGSAFSGQPVAAINGALQNFHLHQYNAHAGRGPRLHLMATRCLTARTMRENGISFGPPARRRKRFNDFVRGAPP
jgi:hypothetical protein